MVQDSNVSPAIGPLSLISKKLLAFSLPLGVIAVVMLGSGQQPAAQATTRPDNVATESPAQLRLTALDTLMKGDKHSALDLYEEAIRLATRQFGSDSTFLGDLYYEAGRLYLDLDQFNQAQDYLTQATKINPKNASARLALAKLLDTREKVQESIGQIREALLINPSSPVARQRFIHTLAKYGQSPSDKAIATQESITLASMTRAARESLQHPSEGDKKAAEKRLEGGKTTSTAPASSTSSAKKGPDGVKAPAIPVLPKHLVPLKEDEKADDEGATGLGITNKGDNKSEPKADNKAEKENKPSVKPDAIDEKEKAGGKGVDEKKPAGILSLFPLKQLGDRKKNDELNREIEARAKKRMEEAIKNGTAGGGANNDVVEKIKEQARHQEDKQAKAKAAQKIERAQEKAREREKARAEAAKAKAESSKAKADPAKTKADAAKTAAKAAAPPKPAAKQDAAPAQQAPVQQAPVQQVPMQQMMPMQPMYMQPYQAPVFSPPPKTKHGAGFVPPPPPTQPMYPGMMPPVVPQVIPAQAPKPVVKPKVEKPKAPPKEEAKPVEDKPPPMTTGPGEDPGFLLDWADLKEKQKGKKKTTK